MLFLKELEIRTTACYAFEDSRKILGYQCLENFYPYFVDKIYDEIDRRYQDHKEHDPKDDLISKNRVIFRSLEVNATVDRKDSDQQ